IFFFQAEDGIRDGHVTGVQTCALPILAALRRVDLKESARGPLKVDDFGNPIQNIYIRKVERVGGKLQNTVIATYPAVSQFWKYKPDEYMKRPLYGRDYPPCKYCQ